MVRCRDFILSVAAAEEEERRRVEQEAAQGGHRSRRGSMLTPVPQGPDAARLPSHASFLASLSREERGVIGEPPAAHLHATRL